MIKGYCISCDQAIFMEIGFLTECTHSQVKLEAGAPCVQSAIQLMFSHYKSIERLIFVNTMATDI